MKHLFTSIFCLLAFSSFAQEFDIRTFEAEPSDLSARKELRRTVNDEPCALMKVLTNIKGMQFESNIGIVDVVHKDDGYWVYIAPKERRIKLMAPDYLPREVDMPEPAQALMVYKLVAATKGTSVAKSDLVRITFRINESNAYVRHGNKAPVMAVGSNAVYDLARGNQTFTFSKKGFEDRVIEIDVQEDQVIDVNLNPGTPATTMELPGFIIVTSEPEGAEVFLNDQRVGQTPYQGRQLPGTYTLSLRNHLHHNHEEQFTLAKGGTVTLATIELKPRFGFLQLSTNLEGVDVYVDGKLVGKSPIDGLQVESGNHKLSMRSSLYHEREENFTMDDGENKTLSFAMNPAFGSLEITSDPSGAEVFLDERSVGTTPFKEEQQPSGSYNLRLELPLHSTERTQIEVNDEERTERFFALTKNYGTLLIESDGADIYIDGKQVGTGTFDHRAAPGSYTLTAKKDRHDDDTQEVFLTVGQAETVSLIPVPRIGAISIMTTPFEASGAEIWIDGKKTKYTTPAVVELLEGEYEIRLKKQDFNDETLSVKIESDAQVEKEIEMNEGANYPEGTVHCMQEGTKLIEVLNPKTGRIWMDRNLGAERAATTSTDVKAYGDLYQWGRFSDGHQCRNSSTTKRSSRSNVSNHGNFILSSNDPYDWLNTPNDDLWQGLEGINNPCPSGYRLPTVTELNEERLSWKSNKLTGAFNSPLKLTASGSRLGNRGELFSVSHSGNYWSGSVLGAKARSLYFNSSSAGIYSDYRANGYSIRCIKD